MDRPLVLVLKTTVVLPCVLILLAGCGHRDGVSTSTQLSNALTGACLTSQTLIAKVDPVGNDSAAEISKVLETAFDQQHWKRIRSTANGASVRGELYHARAFEAEVFIIPVNEVSGIVLMNGRSHNGMIRGFVKAEWRLQNSKIVIDSPSFENLHSE